MGGVNSYYITVGGGDGSDGNGNIYIYTYAFYELVQLVIYYRW